MLLYNLPLQFASTTSRHRSTPDEHSTQCNNHQANYTKRLFGVDRCLFQAGDWHVVGSRRTDAELTYAVLMCSRGHRAANTAS